MSLILLIYLADIIEGLGKLSIFSACILFVAAPVTFAMTIDKYGSLYDTAFKVKHSICLAVMSLACAIFAVLVPSKTTIYTMAGVYYGREVLNSPKVTALGDKAYKLLEEKLDEALKSDRK